MDELREAFVRARFAEPAIFGRPDIEEWLEDQRANLPKGIDQEPWAECDGFDEYALAAWGDEAPRICEQVAALLREYATPSASKPDWTEQDDVTSRFVKVIEVLRTGVAEVFYCASPGQLMNDSWALVIIDGKAYCAMSKTTEGKDLIAALVRTNVIDGMEFILEEVKNGRPKAEQALNFLLREYQRAIQSAREEAERDFDEAVAVSADGTKIVKVDWVAVIPVPEDVQRNWPRQGFSVRDSAQTKFIFPASAFDTNKILRCEHLIRVELPYRFAPASLRKNESIDEEVLNAVVHEAMEAECGMPWNHREQILAVVKPWRNLHGHVQPETKIFLTADYLCPDPLPEGGREIRV